MIKRYVLGFFRAIASFLAPSPGSPTEPIASAISAASRCAGDAGGTENKDVEWLRGLADDEREEADRVNSPDDPDGNPADYHLLRARRFDAIATTLAASRNKGQGTTGDAAPPSPTELLVALQDNHVTDRHLKMYSSLKQASRSDGLAFPYHGCSMVEAVILWWEADVRDEVLSARERELTEPGTLPAGRVPSMTRREMREYYEDKRATACHAADDGECYWSDCPQLRDGEPTATGRHCPLDADPASRPSSHR